MLVKSVSTLENPPVLYIFSIFPILSHLIQHTATLNSASSWCHSFTLGRNSEPDTDPSITKHHGPDTSTRLNERHERVNVKMENSDFLVEDQIYKELALQPSVQACLNTVNRVEGGVFEQRKREHVQDVVFS